MASPLLSPRRREHFKNIRPLENPPVQPDRPWSLIFELAVPNVVSSLAMYSTTVITTLCISHEDQPALLAAFGLGNLIGNVLGLSIGVGLTSVLETLVSQAFGARNLHLTAIHLNRARLVVSIAVIPCMFCLYYTDFLLTWLGQDPGVSALAADFTRASLFGLLPFFLYCCTSSFLRSCQHPRPPLAANVIGSFIHLFVSVYLINIRGLELWGAGLAMSINNILRFVILEIFLSWRPELHGHEWTSETLSPRGIRHFLGLGIPSFLLVAIEWSAFELQAVFAGWVSTEGLAAHVAGINVIAIVFMVPNGISQSLSTLIGASIGEGLPNLAIEFSKKGPLLMFGLACSYGAAIFVWENAIARLYSTDQAMLQILTTILTMTSVFVVVDAMNTIQAGIIRGLGLQSRAAKYQAVAMLGVMLPIGYFTYPYMGVPGIWTGSIVGLSVSALLFFSILYRADFKECSRRAIQEAHRAHHTSFQASP